MKKLIILAVLTFNVNAAENDVKSDAKFFLTNGYYPPSMTLNDRKCALRFPSSIKVTEKQTKCPRAWIGFRPVWK